MDNFLLLSCYTVVVAYYDDCIECFSFLSPSLWFLLVVIRQSCFHTAVNYMNGIYDTPNLQYFITHASTIAGVRLWRPVPRRGSSLCSMRGKNKKWFISLYFMKGRWCPGSVPPEGRFGNIWRRKRFSPREPRGPGQVLAWGVWA